MQNFKIITTGDGSRSIINQSIDEAYHSIHGARTESECVFIKHGLSNFSHEHISILEVGYGSGLNALLSFEANAALQNTIDYQAIDNNILPDEFYLIHQSAVAIDEEHYSKFCKPWNAATPVSNSFLLTKQCCSIADFISESTFDLVYFDAFSPDKQPETWSIAIFNKLFTMMNKGGILVTYSSKGIVKRALREAGFTVKRLPGPPHKRHVIQAIKPL